MRGGSGGRADVFGLRARATTLPARRPETAKPLRGKRMEFGGNKRAGEGTHQATGVGARRATFLRMNLSCRKVRVPWVRPADARLIASILVNDTPHATLRRCPSTHRCRIASCHWAAVASRSAPPVVDVSGWISMNSRRNPRFHRRRTPCARTNRSRGARGSHFVRDVTRVGYRRLMLIWHFVRKNYWWPTPNRAQSHKKKADEIRKRRKLWTAAPHAPRFAARARAACAGFARALVFPSITPFRADSLDAAHAPPRSERARPSRRRTYRVSPDVSSRPSVQEFSAFACTRVAERRRVRFHAGDRLGLR